MSQARLVSAVTAQDINMVKAILAENPEQITDLNTLDSSGNLFQENSFLQTSEFAKTLLPIWLAQAGKYDTSLDEDSAPSSPEDISARMALLQLGNGLVTLIKMATPFSSKEKASIFETMENLAFPLIGKGKSYYPRAWLARSQYARSDEEKDVKNALQYLNSAIIECNLILAHSEEPPTEEEKEYAEQYLFGCHMKTGLMEQERNNIKAAIYALEQALRYDLRNEANITHIINKALFDCYMEQLNTELTHSPWQGADFINDKGRNTALLPLKPTKDAAVTLAKKLDADDQKTIESKTHDLALTSDVPDIKYAQVGKIYLSSDSKTGFIAHSWRTQSSFSIPDDIDLRNLSNRLNDNALKKSILAITAQIPFSGDISREKAIEKILTPKHHHTSEPSKPASKRSSTHAQLAVAMPPTYTANNIMPTRHPSPQEADNKNSDADKPSSIPAASAPQQHSPISPPVVASVSSPETRFGRP